MSTNFGMSDESVQRTAEIRYRSAVVCCSRQNIKQGRETVVLRHRLYPRRPQSLLLCHIMPLEAPTDGAMQHPSACLGEKKAQNKGFLALNSPRTRRTHTQPPLTDVVERRTGRD